MSLLCPSDQELHYETFLKNDLNLLLSAAGSYSQVMQISPSLIGMMVAIFQCMSTYMMVTIFHISVLCFKCFYMYVCMDGLEEILPQLYLEVWIISLIIDNHWLFSWTDSWYDWFELYKLKKLYRIHKFFPETVCKKVGGVDWLRPNSDNSLKNNLCKKWLY